MSSTEARPNFNSPADIQLLQTEHSYEASKYQMDLLGTMLDGSNAMRHVIVEPGVVRTGVSKALIGVVLETLMVAMFYFVSYSAYGISVSQPDHNCFIFM